MTLIIHAPSGCLLCDRIFQSAAQYFTTEHTEITEEDEDFTNRSIRAAAQIIIKMHSYTSVISASSVVTFF